jgi:hypothetical protein
MSGYPADRLHEEVAYLSMYLHWPYEQVMRLDHGERRRWVEQVAAMNQERGAPEGAPDPFRPR